MKKLLLVASVVFLSITGANAQCTPDPQYTTPGIYPDSATGFASACQDQYYEQIITNVVPVDTCAQIFPLPAPCITLTFDSIIITSFTGLPASGNLTYACNTSLGGCSFAGGQTGCAIVSGTPSAADVGVHNLVITVEVYVGGTGVAQPNPVIIDWYSIEVFPAGSCTNEINEGTSSSLQLYPNPTDNVLTLDGLSSNTESITITNLSGQIMNVFTNVNDGSMDINVEHLQSGIYFVRINNSEVIRFVKK